MSNLQQLADRVTHLEMIQTEMHPDKENYLEALSVQHMSPEDAKQWRAERKAKNDALAVENGAMAVVENLGPAIQARAEEILKLRINEMVTAELAKRKLGGD